MTDAPTIAPDLLPLAVSVKKLRHLDRNPRKGDVAAVMKSYKRFGQRKPIVARRDGTVIAGNHQLAAARKLGWTQIAVVWVDDDDTTATAYALADNRVGDLGTYDRDTLAELLAEVHAADENLLADTGYSETDLTQLLESRKVNAPDEFPAFGDDIATEHRCPKCGYEWSGKTK